MRIIKARIKWIVIVMLNNLFNSCESPFPIANEKKRCVAVASVPLRKLNKVTTPPTTL